MDDPPYLSRTESEMDVHVAASHTCSSAPCKISSKAEAVERSQATTMLQKERLEYELVYSNITYDVLLKGGKDAGSTKRILHHISSSCVSGRLTALMGPSGAGKSSLLDILAGVKTVGKAKGEVLLNGVPRKECGFTGLCSYVQQKDVLVPSATVREALVTSALLKLPRSMSKAQKLQRVDELLTLLELAHVANSFIGDEALGIKGISGGEKRRVSVGVEVVKDPAIIFLDEPTTGLDSEMALGVITSLKAMAKAGKMVVATIHQPNSMITDHFDDWALLAKGRLLYSGPWGDAVAYFERAGHACPMYRNPTDFFMSLASNAAIIQDLEAAFKQHREQRKFNNPYYEGQPGPEADCQLPLSKHQLQLPEGGSSSSTHRSSSTKQRDVLRDSSSELMPWHNQSSPPAAAEEAAAGGDVEQGQLSTLPAAAAGTTASASAAAGNSAYSVTLASAPTLGPCDWQQHTQQQQQQQHKRWSLFPRICSDRYTTSGSSSSVPGWYAVWVLAVRMFRGWMRTPIMATAEAAQYLILAIFLGLLYLRQAAVLPDAPYDRMSAIFLVLTMLAFTPSYTILVMWDHERQLLRRETSTNMYSRTAFFLAKTLTTTPVEVAQVTVFAVMTYFMFGFQAVAHKFIIYWAVLIMFALCSETLGYMAAIVTPDSKVGVAMLSILLVLLMSFSGYLVRSIPVYFAWIPKISYFSFATDILVSNEFSGLTFALANGGGSGVPGQVLIPAAMRTGLSMGGNIAVLLGITVGCRLACLVLLEVAARFKFL